jgi:hypothetical protein
MIFLIAVEELGLSPELCFVIEDATSGVQAAKARGMAAIGVARLGDKQQLVDAGAALVVTTLDDVFLPALLVEGRLEERQVAEEIRRRYSERPPDVWTLVYDGFDPGRQGLREALCALGKGYFVTQARCPRRQPTTSTTRAPTWPANTTGSSATSQAVKWRTRTWSTSPTGYHCNFASPMVPGSTCSSPASKTIGLNTAPLRSRSSNSSAIAPPYP